MDWKYTGAPRRQLPRMADFAWMSNEDLGYVANLVTNTNDVLEISLPYVASIDLFNETMILESIESMIMLELPTIMALADAGDMHALEVAWSMLDKPLSATFQGALGDSEDEAMKSKLGGPNFFGQRYANSETAASASSSRMDLNCVVGDHWTPPARMRLRTPIFESFWNVSAELDLATGSAIAVTTTVFENTAQRYWWSPSKLKRSERLAARDVIKYMLIDT